MKLYGTPLSHFTRKVRILLDQYGQAYDFVDVGNVGDSDTGRFGGNPLMSVPVLKDGDVTLIESDDIARYLVDKLDPQDRFRVLTNDAKHLTARAVLNGIMAAEVRLILAERSGLQTAGAPYFDKARSVIQTGLDWLDSKADLFDPDDPGYLDFHLVSAWDHLAYYETADLNQTRLTEIAGAVSAHEQIAATAPDRLKPKA